MPEGPQRALNDAAHRAPGRGTKPRPCSCRTQARPARYLSAACAAYADAPALPSACSRRPSPRARPPLYRVPPACHDEGTGLPVF